MILHRDRYFEHLYEVKFDLISVVWPDIEDLYLPEILNSVNNLVINVRNYNIRNLLIDASQSRVLSSYEDADRVIHTFIEGLASSQLAKLARVESLNQDRERNLIRMAEEMNKRYQYETKFFKEMQAARNWLAA